MSCRKSAAVTLEWLAPRFSKSTGEKQEPVDDGEDEEGKRRKSRAPSARGSTGAISARWMVGGRAGGKSSRSCASCSLESLLSLSSSPGLSVKSSSVKGQSSPSEDKAAVAGPPAGPPRGLMST